MTFTFSVNANPARLRSPPAQGPRARRSFKPEKDAEGLRGVGNSNLERAYALLGRTVSVAILLLIRGETEERNQRGGSRGQALAEGSRGGAAAPYPLHLTVSTSSYCSNGTGPALLYLSLISRCGAFGGPGVSE